MQTHSQGVHAFLKPMVLITMAAAVMGVGGCVNHFAQTNCVRLTDQPVERMTEPSCIEIVQQEPARPYTKIAFVFSQRRAGGGWGMPEVEGLALQGLRCEAGKVGADAVMDVQSGVFDAGSRSYTFGSGQSYTTGNASARIVGNNVYAQGNATTFGTSSAFTTTNHYVDLAYRATAIVYTDGGKHADTAKPPPEQPPETNPSR